MMRAIFLGAFWCGVGLVLSPIPPVRAAEIDFAQQIQPLLAGRCLKCHGLGEQEGGLSLADRAAATAPLDSGARAVVPEHPEKSELIRRVTATDADVRMPPKGPPLSPTEVELLRRWIAGGAAWPEHWAYRPLAKPAVPEVQSAALRDWRRTPLDAFVAAKLEARGLTPAVEADRRTLLRRLSFDLVGLPPSPEDMSAFLADRSPLAYEQAVDRLLASVHYGERWARHWMDLVHYAETHGHDQDRIRENAWPYRDYLIRAFNADKPYAQFVEEQVAGDALYAHDPWATIATGFLATGPWDESSLRDIREDTVDREVARYLDRDDIVTTVMSTFASTTVHCARCHDHKFDPIKQTEYYGLQAVFAATDKANRPVDSDPAVAARRQALLARKAHLPGLREGKDLSLLDAATAVELAAWEKSLPQESSRWRVVDVVEARSSGGATLTRQDDGSYLSGGERPERDVVTVVARTDLARVTGVRLEVLTDERLPHHGPGRQDNGNLHLNEFAVSVVAENGSGPRKLAVRKAEADFNQEGWSVDLALDGKPNTAWGIYPQVGQPHRAIFELATPVDLSNSSRLAFELHQIHGGGHLIGRMRLSVTDQPLALGSAASTLPPEVAAALAVPAEKRSTSERGQMAAWYVGERLNRELAALPKAQLVYSGTSTFEADGSFRPAPSPRRVQVLGRGNIATPLGDAAPGALSLLKDAPPSFAVAGAGEEAARRAALARWLSSTQNALVWRSIANRVWQHHFGRGLVDTPSDFGHMGAAPSHPELLDWLAVYLQEHGGSLKDLHRAIVTSAVYRQTSTGQNDVAARVDGDNRLLWRQNRRRLDAESLHDAVLVAAGQLDARLGGPSVKQFLMSPGVHVTPVLDYANFSVNDPAIRRRAVYRFVFRTLPDPLLDALDCPDASQLVAQRTESVTALQALATVNDKFMVRESEHIAAVVLAQAATPDEQVAVAFQRLLLREPTAEERAAVAAYANKHGLANACRWLLNTNEFMFVD